MPWRTAYTRPCPSRGAQTYSCERPIYLVRTAMVSLLRILRVVVRECRDASFSDEPCAERLAVVDEFRAIFLPRPVSAYAALLLKAESPLLQLLPPELLSNILAHIDTPNIACLAATCRSLWLDAPTAPPPPPREIGLVEAELRRRTEARRLHTATFLPDWSLSWVSFLLRGDRRDAVRQQTLVAVGSLQSLFVDTEGRLHSCGDGCDDVPLLLGHAEDSDADPTVPREFGPPTPVPSM